MDRMYLYRWQRQGHPVTLFPTSDLDELERALRLLRVIPMMQQTGSCFSRRARHGARPVAGRSQKTIGGRGRGRRREDLQRPDCRRRREGGCGRGRALDEGGEAILEPNQEDIAKAARVSIALQDLMKQQQAQGWPSAPVWAGCPRDSPAWASRGSTTAASRPPARATWTRC